MHGATLPPGVYKIFTTPSGQVRFAKQPLRDEPLLSFTDQVDVIIDEIRMFWERGHVYKALKFPHRRGILFYGPPGTGKTSQVRMVLDEVVERGGIGLFFSDVATTREGYKVLRKIQPDVPVVIAIEDLEDKLGRSERYILDFMDGHDVGTTNTVFIATTNYIDKIPDRIKNRPSRFDKKIKVDLPCAEFRKVYLDRLVEGIPTDLNVRASVTSLFAQHDAVEDTEGFSLAHIKELFVALTVFGSDYKETIQSLREMTA